VAFSRAGTTDPSLFKCCLASPKSTITTPPRHSSGADGVAAGAAAAVGEEPLAEEEEEAEVEAEAELEAATAAAGNRKLDCRIPKQKRVSDASHSAADASRVYRFDVAMHISFLMKVF
jgi:hypothetical protein